LEKILRSVVRNIANFEAPWLCSLATVQQNPQNQKTKFCSQKLLNSMAECGKEFGEDFTNTLYLAAILSWPTLTKKRNNAFLHRNNHFS
jgi:hypothetical protein